jgi:hypothetical protein
MRKNRSFLALLSLLVASSVVSPGQASTLYGVNYSGPATLFKVDQASGALSTFALPPGPGNDIGDLTSSATTIYGINIPNNTLVSYDAAGAIASSVAITNTQSLPIVSLAFDKVTNQLYGNTSVPFGGASFDQLFKIDTVTGVATPVGTGIGFSSVFALGFDNKGGLYGIDSTNKLISISTATGAGAAIGPTGQTSLFDLAFRPEDNVGFVASTGTHSLYTLDPLTGALTLVGPYGSNENIVGLAFVSDVPEPGTLALFAIGGITAAGWRRWKMRSTPHTA